MKHTLLAALMLAPLAALPAAAPPVVCWTFDEARATGAVQQAGERLDALQGAIECVPGVRGSGLKFDGFTSRLVRAAKDLPQFGPALTVEAWIAPQEYSWAWTGIVDHEPAGQRGTGGDDHRQHGWRDRDMVVGEAVREPRARQPADQERQYPGDEPQIKTAPLRHRRDRGALGTLRLWRPRGLFHHALLEPQP